MLDWGASIIASHTSNSYLKPKEIITRVSVRKNSSTNGPKRSPMWTKVDFIDFGRRDG